MKPAPTSIVKLPNCCYNCVFFERTTCCTHPSLDEGKDLILEDFERSGWVVPKKDFCNYRCCNEICRYHIKASAVFSVSAVRERTAVKWRKYHLNRLKRQKNQ